MNSEFVSFGKEEFILTPWFHAVLPVPYLVCGIICLDWVLLCMLTQCDMVTGQGHTNKLLIRCGSFHAGFSLMWWN